MKRKSSRYRAMLFSARLVRPIENGHRAKKIFVIKREMRVPGVNEVSKRIRSILIFDDHPDSLRLVFGPDENRHAYPSAPQRVISWELILAAILTMGAVIGMFWPIL